MRRNNTPLALLLSLATLLLAACGGGGSSDTGTTPAPTPTTAVAPYLSLAVPASTYPAGSAELGGWTVLQQARLACGFGALQQDHRLDAAAKLHAQYLTSVSLAGTDSILSHYETVTSNFYYRGYYPWDRTVVQNYGDQVAEILEATTWNYDTGNPPALPTLEQRGAASIRDLLNTVYHLTGAMYHGYDIGFGADLQTAQSGTSVREEYRFGALNGYQTQTLSIGTGVLATYPCNGSATVPSAFYPANESPNPFPTITSTSQTVGPPIYLKVDAPQVLTLTSASVSAGGVSAATTVLTHGNDPNGEIGANEVFVIPNNALTPNTSYLVTLAGTINRTPFTRSFTLTTSKTGT